MSLVIVILYIAVDIFVLVPNFRLSGKSESEHFPGQHLGSILVFIAFVCIWWPDITGAILIGARYSPIPDEWTIIVRMLGWIILALAITMRIRLLWDGLNGG